MKRKLFEEFMEEDAAAVAMYTYDFGPNNFENNPCRIINRSLVGGTTLSCRGQAGCCIS